MAKTRLEIDSQIHRAAGVMLATLERRQVRNGPNYRSRTRRSWLKETIVHPLLRSQMTNGAPIKPGLKLAVGALADLMQLDDLKVRNSRHRGRAQTGGALLRAAREVRRQR